MRLFLLVTIISAATAYNFRFKSKVADGAGCEGPAIGVPTGLDISHCSGDPPLLPRPSGAHTTRRAQRSSTRDEHGWRVSKGEILGKGEKEVRADVAQPSNPDKCANLQASCKCGGKDVSDPEQAVDILLKDAEVYNPIFEALMNFLVNEAAGKTDEKGFKWRKPEVVPAPIKGKPRCVEKIKQKYGCPKLKGCRQLTDVVRGSLIFDDEQSICFFLANVIKSDNGVICQGDACKELKTQFDLSKVSVRFAKNRFDRDAEGMRDYLVNIHMEKSTDKAGHVAELQIHHRRQVEAKHVFHCVYSYVRKIQEARMMMHIQPSEIFCDEDKCKDYWVDTKQPKKNKACGTCLDSGKHFCKDGNGYCVTSRAECKNDATMIKDEVGCMEQKSPLDIIYEKWIKGDDTIGKRIWNNYIKPHLADQNCIDDDCKIKGRDPAETNVPDMIELKIFTDLADKMTEEYDIATLPSPEGATPILQPMFQDEKCTAHVDGTGFDQSCPEDVKCKCSQRAVLTFEADTKDCTTNSCS